MDICQSFIAFHRNFNMNISFKFYLKVVTKVKVKNSLVAKKYFVIIIYKNIE